jgi:hypothetical protein
MSAPVFGDVQASTVPMDFVYLLTLAQHYGQSGTFATGDVTGDGKVNFDDLLLLAQNYGHPLPAAAAPQLTAAALPQDAASPGPGAAVTSLNKRARTPASRLSRHRGNHSN